MRLVARVVLYRLILRPFLALIIGVKFPKATAFPEGQFLLVREPQLVPRYDRAPLFASGGAAPRRSPGRGRGLLPP